MNREGLLMKYPSFWVNASPRRKRVYSIIAVFIIALFVTIIGTAVPLSSQDASAISNQLNQTLSEHRADNTLVPYIFINNFSICLLMFIPLVGAALGLFILFDTGIALGAITATQGFPAWLGLLSLVITPVFWLEFAAYSVAMASSISGREFQSVSVQVCLPSAQSWKYGS
jgi:hypothetical protein